MPLRVVFMGTPAFAVPTLRRLVAEGHELAAIYTRAPQPAGRRGLSLTKSPVHLAADELGLPVETPPTLRSEGEIARFNGHAADIGVVVAYGMILPNAVLEAPPLGVLNVHASLLPRWRGAGPIQRAVMAGDAETGITIMRVEEKLDSGPIALQGKVPIDENTTAGELLDRLPQLGAQLMAQALQDIEAGRLHFVPQPEAGVTYAPKIDKIEARIDWSWSASRVHDHVRGLSPFPGAWFEADLGHGPERVKVLRTMRLAERDGAAAAGTLTDIAGVVACGMGSVRIVELQRAGKSPMGFADFLRGARLSAGARFG